MATITDKGNNTLEYRVPVTNIERAFEGVRNTPYFLEKLLHGSVTITRQTGSDGEVGAQYGAMRVRLEGCVGACMIEKEREMHQAFKITQVSDRHVSFKVTKGSDPAGRGSCCGIPRMVDAECSVKAEGHTVVITLTKMSDIASYREMILSSIPFVFLFPMFLVCEIPSVQASRNRGLKELSDYLNHYEAANFPPTMMVGGVVSGMPGFAAMGQNMNGMMMNMMQGMNQQPMGNGMNQQHMMQLMAQQQQQPVVQQMGNGMDQQQMMKMMAMAQNQNISNPVSGSEQNVEPVPGEVSDLVKRF